MRYPRPHSRSTAHQTCQRSPRFRCTAYSQLRKRYRGTDTGREHIRTETLVWGAAAQRLMGRTPMVGDPRGRLLPNV